MNVYRVNQNYPGGEDSRIVAKDMDDAKKYALLKNDTPILHISLHVENVEIARFPVNKGSSHEERLAAVDGL